MTTAIWPGYILTNRIASGISGSQGSLALHYEYCTRTRPPPNCLTQRSGEGGWVASLTTTNNKRERAREVASSPLHRRSGHGYTPDMERNECTIGPSEPGPRFGSAGRAAALGWG